MTARRLHCAENSRKAGYGADSSTGFRLLQKSLSGGCDNGSKITFKKNPLLSFMCLFTWQL